MKYQIDFHCHTIASDGGYTIPELAKAAKTAGLGALVITDHCYSKGSFFSNKHILYTFKNMGIELPVPVIVGAEVCTPFCEFLLFGAKAVSNWYYVRDSLKEVNNLLGASSYWKMFKDHVVFGGSWSSGGIDDFGEKLKDKVVGCELPYAMIMCHPGKTAEAYSKMPDEMFALLHGYEIGNSGI